MRVLHLNATDIDGGAARGAFWLHKALAAQGADSLMLVDRKYGSDDSVLGSSGLVARLSTTLRARLDQLPLRQYRMTRDSYWTIGWVPSQVERLIRRHQPDIVHLHWTGAGFLPIDTLERLRFPMVWTLRDMWAFTGGCHYTAGCDRYRQACGRCPQLRSDIENDLSRHIWERKRKHWRDLNLWLVPLSNWLAECARASSLFKGCPVTVIPNGLDIRRFCPIDKRQARETLGFPPDKQIILYGAIGSTRDPRKGFSKLLEALHRFGQRNWVQRAAVAVFGDLPPEPQPDIGLETHYVGHVSDDDCLALLYSSADVMVAPSLQEAFGKTLIEAMACGTPVVAFNSGGPADIVGHMEDGYLARPFCAQDLAEGIAWCLEEEGRSVALGRKARSKVERRYDINIIAQRYRSLYQRVLARAPA